jgi:hypothetical protein
MRANSTAHDSNKKRPRERLRLGERSGKVGGTKRPEGALTLREGRAS